MSPSDLAELTARIESALADSIKEFGGGVASPGRVALLVNAAWALANHDDTRAILTDRAVQAIGGSEFRVTVDDEQIVIEAAEAPKERPPAEPRVGVTVPADGVVREVSLG